MTRFFPFIPVLALAITPITLLADAPPPGSRAILSTFAHDVSGTARIIDADTFVVDDFVYDGGGVEVYFTLAPIDAYASFRDEGVYVGPNLLGMPSEGESITIDLPDGMTFDGSFGISVWCVPFQANFGSGMFSCPTDFNGDGFVTGDDFDLYVSAFELGDDAADFDGNGFVTGDDFDAFVEAFEAGC